MPAHSGTRRFHNATKVRLTHRLVAYRHDARAHRCHPAPEPAPAALDLEATLLTAPGDGPASAKDGTAGCALAVELLWRLSLPGSQAGAPRIARSIEISSDLDSAPSRRRIRATWCST